MPPRIGKVRVTLSLDAQLVLKATLAALRRSTQQGRRIGLQDLVEAGLRHELQGEPGKNEPNGPGRSRPRRPDDRQRR
jgi:hypothetical protein